jgi:type III secretion protein T
MNESEIEFIKKLLLCVSITTPRMLAIFSIFPLLSTNVLQGVSRNVVIFSFAIMVVPFLYPLMPDNLTMNLDYFVILIKEIIIGVFMGFLFSIIFWAVEGIGNFIANQCGGSMAGMSDPIAGEDTTPLGSLFMQTSIVLFISYGGFFLLLSTIFESYHIWPVFSFYPKFDKDIALFFLNQADKLFSMIILLSSPVIITIFLTEFGLGLVSRFSPQLNVFFLAMPVKAGVAMFVLILYLSFLFSFFKGHFLNFSQSINFLGELLR